MLSTGFGYTQRPRGRTFATTATTFAESLGFQRRIVHGKNKSEWLRELLLRTGEPSDPGMQQQTS
jgi:hypothetical protein